MLDRLSPWPGGGWRRAEARVWEAQPRVRFVNPNAYDIYINASGAKIKSDTNIALAFVNKCD